MYYNTPKKYASRWILTGLFLGLVLSCSQKNPQENTTAQAEAYPLAYAQNFKIIPQNDYTLVQVLANQNIVAQYALVRRGKKVILKDNAIPLVEIPIKRIALLSTTDIPFVEALGMQSCLVGVPEQEYVNSSAIQKMIRQNKVAITGGAVSVNTELLASLKPQLILATAPWDKSGDKTLDKFQELRLPFALNSSYLEPHPLGRAEWIKFVAVFFDKLAQAEKIFDNIAQDYAQMLQLVKEQANRKPKVLLNIPYNGTWYVPGGSSYMATLLQDAGADYIWQKEKQTRSLSLGWEAIMQQATEADVWIHFDNISTKKALQKTDKRFEKIKAFQIGNLWNNNLARNSLRGNDFYEKGVLHPEWILADLIKIFHPKLKLPPQHIKFRFYQKVK